MTNTAIGWRAVRRYRPTAEALRELRSSAFRRPSIGNRYIYPLITGGAYFFGGLLGLGTIALPRTVPLNKTLLVSIALSCLVIGVLVYGFGHLLKMGAYHFLLAGGTTIITVVVLVLGHDAPGRTVNLASLYLFIAIGCAFFFGWAPAVFHLVALEICSYFAYRAVGLHESDVLVQQGCLILVSRASGWLSRSAALAGRDSLTTLLNRRGFDAALSDAMTDARRTGRPLSIVLFDLDRFKTINDLNGHLEGDRTLRRVAATWKNLVSKDQPICRIGGDEFALIIPEHSATQAVAIAEKLRAAMPMTTCSAGVAQMHEGDSRSMLVSRADVALYEAKSRGGDQTQQHDTVRDSDADSTCDAIRRGLVADEFEVFYQPIVDLSSGVVTGDEALIRWHRPMLGVVPPDEFIPAAERGGAIVALGRWVLRQACTNTADYIRRSGIPRRISVNASVHELKCSDYAENVALTLEQTGLDPANLIIEVTESTFDADNPQVTYVLRELRRLGVDIAIDDFGTGFSSLNRLNQLPVNVLKIDRTFVSAIHSSSDDLPVLKAIVALANALQLKITAEGVETFQQAELLSKLGCSHAQGFYFGRPQPELLPISTTRATGSIWNLEVSQSA